MFRLRRLVLLRHGETVGQSSIRFYGSTDVALSEEGRAHARAARLALRSEIFDLVVASPLQRAWSSACIATGGARIRLDCGLREVHFGRWEGLTAEEIAQRDPALYRDWQGGVASFEYPRGEKRVLFRERVLAALDRIEHSGRSHVLLVAHKGVIRIIAEHLLGAPLEPALPALGQAVGLRRGGGNAWQLGRIPRL